MTCYPGSQSLQEDRESPPSLFTWWWMCWRTNYYFVSKKKKKKNTEELLVLSSDLYSTYTDQRNGKLGWSETKHHFIPNGNSSPRYCVTLIRPLLTHHWGLISKRYLNETFGWVLLHSRSQLPPHKYKALWSVCHQCGLSYKCHCISRANFCDKDR